MKYLALLFSFTLAFRFYGHIQENGEIQNESLYPIPA